MLEQLLDVLFLRDDAFIKLEKRPRFGAMLAVLLASTGAVFAWYALQLDTAWFGQAVLGLEGGDGGGAAGAAIDARTVAFASLASSVAGGLALLVLNALYLHLLAQAIGAEHRYRAWLALCVWTSAPQLFTTALMAARLFIGDASRLTPEDLQLASLNGLFLELPASSPWRSLAASLNLATAWQLLLLAVGFSAWTGRRLGVATVAVVLPWGLVYLGWALVIVAVYA